MNYKDLHHIYWQISKTLLMLDNPESYSRSEIEEQMDNLEMILLTVNEELRELENCPF